MAQEEKTGSRMPNWEPPTRSANSQNTVIRPKEWERQTALVLVTPEQIVEMLLDLEIIFPGQNLDRQQAARKYRLFCGDLGHLTEQQLRLACERYRKNPESRFFPTPGQLLALVR